MYLKTKYLIFLFKEKIKTAIFTEKNTVYTNPTLSDFINEK